MSRKYRLILMAISAIILCVIGWFIKNDFSFLTEDFWFTSGLLLLVLLSLVDQPFFSKDSDIFVNAVTASLSLLLIPAESRDTIFWIFLGVVSYLILSSYIIMLLRRRSLFEESNTIQFFSRFNRQIGKPNVLFSAFFLWGGIRQFSLDSSEFNALLWFWIVFTLLSIPSLAGLIEKVFQRKPKTNSDMAIGKIFGVQSKNTFLIKLLEERTAKLKVFDFVEFEYSMDNKRRKGIVLDVYLLNQEQWIKVLTTSELDSKISNVVDKCTPDVVYKIDTPQEVSIMNQLVGIVVEGSVIEKIRFSYNSRVEITNGQLVELNNGRHKVIYQVIQGTTKVELLENKNESGLIIGEAIQLGEWNAENEQFEQYGWVPSINTPIFIASNIQEIKEKDNEYKIGVIPNTNYPIIIDKELAVTHHTAILGVTGCGKSVFTRNLIKNIANDTTKVIIVDLTGEYKTRFKNITPIINDENSKSAFQAIEAIASEKAKFANQQNKDTIQAGENTIKTSFYNSIKSFLEGNNNLSVFEIPDITNNSDILDYTKLFFWNLFKTAKTMNNFGKRVCVVLEEAHTIIPELSTMGVSDFASKATVNSIAQIALQGRKYNIGFIVIAQRTANVSKTVLTQCNSIIAFKSLDKTSCDFLSNYMGQEFINTLPSLKFRTALAVGKAFKSTIPMIFEVPEINEKVYGEIDMNDVENNEQLPVPDPKESP